MTSALGGREGYRGGFTSSLRGSRSFPKVFQHCGGRRDLDLGHDLGGTKVSLLAGLYQVVRFPIDAQSWYRSKCTECAYLVASISPRLPRHEVYRVTGGEYR
jgi:hypothetical protein